MDAPGHVPSNVLKQNPSALANFKYSNIVNVEGLSSELLKTLECPACHLISPPPIYLCVSGHSVCKKCRYTMSTCPKCTGGFSNMRNELAESFLSKLRIKCPYWKHGCIFDSIGGKMLNTHEMTCEFAPIACKVSSGIGCGKLIPISEYSDHLIKEHSVKGMDSSQAVISMSTSVRFGQSNWTFPPHYLRAFGKTFLCYVHASFNILLMWVSLCGFRDELKSFATAITMFDSKNKFLQAKWVGPVHSYLATPKEVYESGNCLTLLPETFVHFTEMFVDEKNRKIKKWKCHFEILEVSDSEETKNKNQIKENGFTESIDTSSTQESPAERKKNKFWDAKEEVDFTSKTYSDY